MAKTSRKKRNEPISINTIYETIKDPKLVQQLWLEIISDIGDKPTYKRIKEMVSCIINGTLSDYETEPADNIELLRRRSVFTEISIMAYTVDRVISEFLYRKLQTEFKSMVGNILEEFQIEKKPKEEASSSKINSMFENIESIFTNKEQNNFDEGSGNIQQVEANQRPVRKRGRPRKSVAPSTPTSSESSLNKIVETIDKSDESENFKAKGRVNSNKGVPVIKGFPEMKDSDQESNLTFNSLSSVHTTDLSSFDDSVSICTDDGKNGRRKKQVPLKKANSMILEGNLSDVYKVQMAVEVNKRKREAVSRKVLPKRRRKPNSKYNAETMYCQVKDYSSARSSSNSGEPSEDSSSEALEEVASTKPEINHETKRAKVSNTKSEHSSPTKPVTTRHLRNGTPTRGSSSQNIPTPTSTSTPLVPTNSDSWIGEREHLKDK